MFLASFPISRLKFGVSRTPFCLIWLLRNRIAISPLRFSSILDLLQRTFCHEISRDRGSQGYLKNTLIVADNYLFVKSEKYCILISTVIFFRLFFYVFLLRSSKSLKILQMTGCFLGVFYTSLQSVQSLSFYRFLSFEIHYNDYVCV